MNTLRPELEPLPLRLRSLPIDQRGYVVPWFVAWQDGVPEFRAMDARKWIRAVREKLCWVCGQRLGRHVAFVVGPMCGINRTTAEPPCHLECAEWSAQHCPFLSRPHAKRREDDLINNGTLAVNAAGHALSRNPGVALVWVTTSYTVFPDGRGGKLIEMGPAERVSWWAEGRPATRAEVVASVTSGLPALERVAATEAHLGATVALAKMVGAFEAFYPPEAL